MVITLIDRPSMESSEFQFGLVKDRRPDGLGELRVLPDELVCAILGYLSPLDVGRLACVSSVMYILCNEEPLWKSLYLSNVKGQLQYKGSWKITALHQLNLLIEFEAPCRKPLHFGGFNSLFLYRRLYRCYTALEGFSFDNGNVERKNSLSLEEFQHEYNGKKPILLDGLADTWPAKTKWTIDQLMLNYGDTPFKISQSSSRKITMKFKDYVSYMKVQHDEDPLYIFDDKFGEVAPGLLKDYSIPYLFQEDFFDILETDQRPPFRWLIIGPERSGASWHVDPALTSAWNTLLSGRKRWAMYPPGRVPLGVTVHVNEEDGDVNIETPTSLQWWLDFYPLLSEEDKPIECTQLPGETIFVPSGWWHCVLNLETTVAVTQNFVDSKNFEFVCLDMAPGYRHKGVCRAGLLALDPQDSFEDLNDNEYCDKDTFGHSELVRKKKRLRISKQEDFHSWTTHEFSYDISFLSMFLDKERDHYNSLWSSGNCIGQREMREWLFKLWVGKPGIRDIIWKGACIALNAGKWTQCLAEICAFHNIPSPLEDERLPVGTGSNPVYLMSDSVIKIYVEGGLEATIHGLGTELQFYSLLCDTDTPLKDYIPEVLASGILYLENGLYNIVPWDGKGVPDVIARCNLTPEVPSGDNFPFGIWSKKQFDCKKAGMSIHESLSSARTASIWPYMITKRCKGKIFAQLRDALPRENVLNLAFFLGEQLRNLHLLPYPSMTTSTFSDIKQEMNLASTNRLVESDSHQMCMPAEWEFFIKTLIRRKKDVLSRLTKWGDPIPSTLLEKIDQYLPDDYTKLLYFYEDANGVSKVWKRCSWVHSDIMDDNILMEQQSNVQLIDNGSMAIDNGFEGILWRPSHLIDFSDLSIGDPIYDLIPIHLDVFRGDPSLLTKFLESYKLPLVRRKSHFQSAGNSDDKFGRLSYHAMCYCILHEENILGAIFSLWKDLRNAKSWEEVEKTVWGQLNSYKGFY